MFEKLKVEKVELVKRVIRQNNYDQYEKTHRQCVELGLNINRQALDRFANKLELIDKAQLSKRQFELHKLEIAAQEQKERRQQQHVSKSATNQPPASLRSNKDRELDAHLEQYDESYTEEAVISTPQPPKRRVAPQQKNKMTRHGSMPGDMTYEQVKQRETEITFELGELKIRENELLQELIRLTEALDKNQKN
ncbi:MAG: hypothetical protein Alis3KO_20140 [Aliiglaciecola sp.]|uniref:hypothetical protein n=1 Tax=Aliiglaciecola sp. M165 TaxID=2593649 RepID=UPI00117E4040|nr:hypothetical protein [Aliiglaciecola sp. M165]TRY30103.1 hypothetical protein FM019_14840 [Aliiglaciecola sp. M165]